MRSFSSQAASRLSTARLSAARPAGGSFIAATSRTFAATALRRDADKQWSTPLAKQLFNAISITGPVPLASYMRMCLTGDLGGYYTGAIDQSRDQFGTKGDFVTSPEISQIFGELIGIWFIAEWMSQGRPKDGVQLIEVGPGRGTLMDDMLRTIQRFPAMAESIDAVYMVEASRELRDAQKKLLCGPDAQMTESKVGSHGAGKHFGKPVVWTDTIKSIPIEPNRMPLIIAHEFFDALPIHSFQTARAANDDAPAAKDGDNKSAQTTPAMEWREMMVSPTPHAQSLGTDTEMPSNGEPPAEFQLVLSPGTTRHSRYVPDSSLRYRKLKQTPDAVVEICPDASIYATDFATRIGGSAQHPKSKPSGAALILDYGTSDTVPINSLRGIRHHKRVDPFSAPGLVDLSADVDFTAIAEVATQASEGVEVHGPVAQGDFLLSMGIRDRAQMLTEKAGVDASTADSINRAWTRLVDKGPNGMGKVYKALAILPENDGQRRPVGFGGDVSA